MGRQNKNAASRIGRRPAPSGIRFGTCYVRFNVPRIMGIVNNTPDSFSGDGVGGDSVKAIDRGKLMFKDGADIVDIGGESTRPGAEPVPEAEEIRRVIPVVEELAKTHPGRISIDTMKPSVAEAALFSGATLVNDVSGLRNPRMTEIVAAHDAAVIIMHMKGEPRTMQARPRYKDVMEEITGYLRDSVAAAERAGVNPKKIIVDPGIGFGKTLEHNLDIIARLGELKCLGKPIAIGVSRKAFVGRLTGLPAEDRVEGSLAAAILAIREGANIVRVHDVRQTVRALAVGWPIVSRTA
jgi:dihydropteroate synthase